MFAEFDNSWLDFGETSVKSTARQSTAARRSHGAENLQVQLGTWSCRGRGRERERARERWRESEREKERERERDVDTNEAKEVNNDDRGGKASSIGKYT